MRHWPTAAPFVWILAGGLLTHTPPATASPAGREPSLFPVAKLTASDGGADDRFGIGVAISGDTVVAGAAGDDDLADGAGAAYVFARDPRDLAVWREVAKLKASDGSRFDEFGGPVGVSGDTAIVGAIFHDDGRGAAYLFERNAGGPGNWGEVAKLTAADGSPNEGFGNFVGIDGDTVVVGSNLDQDDVNADEGAAYVFERDAGGPENWGQVAKLVSGEGADAKDNFGWRVAISGDTIAVAAPDSQFFPARGSVYIFERDAGGLGNWGLAARLRAGDRSTTWRFRDGFGYSVAISGDVLVAAAVPIDSGGAYIFERDAGGPENWGLVATLPAASGGFGQNTAISGDTVVMGAHQDIDVGSDSGSAYIFRRDAGGPGNWGAVAKLTAADGAAGDEFGRGVGISGDTIVLGASRDDDLGPDSGSAYIFQPTLLDPSLAISGACPGEITLLASGLTPRGAFTLYGAVAEGLSFIPSGFCAGTDLGLDEAVGLRTGRVDGQGARTAKVTLSEQHCGAFLQLVDATSCATSAVVQLP